MNDESMMIYQSGFLEISDNGKNHVAISYMGNMGASMKDVAREWTTKYHIADLQILRNLGYEKGSPDYVWTLIVDMDDFQLVTGK